jgi:hypothetical protein
MTFSGFSGFVVHCIRCMIFLRTSNCEILRRPLPSVPNKDIRATEMIIGWYRLTKAYDSKTVSAHDTRCTVGGCGRITG